MFPVRVHQLTRPPLHLNYLKMLDPVQHQAIRLCLNAFRTTPVDSLHVEADEMPLDLRRLKFAMLYAIKLFASPLNPAYSVVYPQV